ncbi:nucleotidyltransferase family protein [Acinetobacter sp. 194]|uniref:nucleotidyltransferase family protein n=1 Tax=Acinetobacter shaoyimingii TaxID=2715164 RepID=UPI0014081358|nr:nucleotidyltransferase family protein [Acinetobacter shaoyimingii]NHB59458.1 nucleotidyltransferase family protein [Acinetobacter shaoyimingii]
MGNAYEDQLIAWIEQNQNIMQILEHLYVVDTQAYIAAGIIRNSIWSNLHGTEYALDGTEVDVIFYGLDDDAQAQRIQQTMQNHFPHMEWDVTNQALVHRWYKKDNGEEIPPLISIDHALSLWPETATAIAVRLNAQHQLEYVAPFGLEDLFELKLRWNPTLVSHEGFMKRLESKRFLERWSRLVLIND